MDYRDQLIIDQQKSIENLTNEISALRKEHKEQIQSLNQEIANLNETIRTIAGKRFSPSSESSKEKQIEGQLELDFFNEAEYLAEENPSEPTIDEMLSKAEPLPLKDKKRKTRSKREDLFTDLPIKEEVIPLTEDEKVCDVCNSELIPLGKEFVREEIRIIPAKVERVQLFRESYICPGCKEDDVTEIVKSTVPPALLKHSLASASVVSRVMYDKHVNYLPFNRQAKSFERLGVNLSRSVLANWVNSAALLYLQPMFNRLHEELLKREVIMADETPCQVHKEDGRKNTSKSFMWIYRSGEDTLPEIILYDYQISRSGDHPIDFLNGFSGYLHCDGFSAYNRLTNVTRIACLAHIRRKFVEALPAKSKRVPKPVSEYTPAERGVVVCNMLFKLEREFKDLSPEERQKKRLEKVKPILEAFWRWLDEQNPPSGSNLYKAVNYARNQKEYMNNYLLDGRCPISNNLTENAVRPYTLIRKNSLFHDTPKGATASAIICSIIETAKAAGLDAENYLDHLLSEMPGRLNDPDGIEDLFPWSDTVQKKCVRKSI